LQKFAAKLRYHHQTSQRQPISLVAFFAPGQASSTNSGNGLTSRKAGAKQTMKAVTPE